MVNIERKRKKKQKKCQISLQHTLMQKFQTSHILSSLFCKCKYSKKKNKKLHVSMYCAHVYACHVCKRVLCTCLLVFNMHVLNICMYWAKVFVHMCVHVQMLGVTCEVHAHMNSACIHARAHLLYMYRSV